MLIRVRNHTAGKERMDARLVSDSNVGWDVMNVLLEGRCRLVDGARLLLQRRTLPSSSFARLASASYKNAHPEEVDGAKEHFSVTFFDSRFDVNVPRDRRN
jgi:hypothetical protein